MSTELEITITILKDDISPAEIDEISTRISDAVCGVTHAPEDECPAGDWIMYSTVSVIPSEDE